MTLAPSSVWKARWLEPRTGPLDPLRGRKAICIVDLENLIYSALDLNTYLDIPALTNVLRSATRACVLHAVYSGRPDDASPRRVELEELGWRVHINSIGTNSDSLIIWKAGSLITRSQADCVVLGSGDGDLVETLAHCVMQHLDKPRDVFTLSLPGSTSQRLNALHNPLISGGNLEIGCDCLLHANSL